jgi:hypothetical protein
MASLDRKLRKDLENAVKKARRAAEAGARQVLEQLAVHHHEPWAALAPEQRKLRNRLRAHGRQLGDKLDEKSTQSIDRLAGECAYEHWHRLLFARFLTENDLLVEPDSGMALSLDECRELARERSVDWLILASEYAQRMLPQIFRAGDPVLDVSLPPEKRQELETILEGLPRDVFVADDSLGWVYQFWQAEQKEAVNKSEKKIGAEELPAVTQLFTEDYMVLFLLHNTLGAWWAGKVLAKRPELARADTTEVELRRACARSGVAWEYLRFVKGDDGVWRPAAGTFDGWPKAAKDITVLDPCMGSGHFLVFALPILVAMRMAEEDLSKEAAVDAVLRDNIFGLEIDPRCTQIAAFNLALAAWRIAGYRVLPRLHLACSGLSVSAKESEWLTLANGDARLQAGMKRLYDLFQQAPTLGSLIDPGALGGDLFEAGFRDLAPLLEQAVARELTDETAHEIAVAASGLRLAAEVLSDKFTLVVTNVPYLGRSKQDDLLKDYCETHHSLAKADLATCFVERCIESCIPNGCTALVTPQAWLFLGLYSKLRQGLLRQTELGCVVRLGANAFRDMNWWAATTALLTLNRRCPGDGHLFAGLDVTPHHEPDEKSAALQCMANHLVRQSAQISNPNSVVMIGEIDATRLLANHAESLHGLAPGDTARLTRSFWETPNFDKWKFMCSTPKDGNPFSGKSEVIVDPNIIANELDVPGFRHDGTRAWGRLGVFVGKMNALPVSLYHGEVFDDNGHVLLPKRQEDLRAIYAFASSPEFGKAVREINQKVAVTTSAIVKVPFDLEHWQSMAMRDYPAGLPNPNSTDPTQWLFNGHPKGSNQPLQVAMARLLGYRWPRQTGSSFPDCPALDSDGLEAFADEDGIVCLPALKGEPAASERLRALLATACGSEWSATKLNELLSSVGFAGKSLDGWLSEEFFEQHCDLFHQRPFIWHIWDGLNNGFSALVNYHKLAAPSGEGRRTLEKLIYSYLGDWIDRQRADQKSGIEGADSRVASAEHLKRELEKILEGEPPYDIFVRWKPLHEQPVGWDPDINDGVRINIRPFMMAKTLSTNGKKQAKGACILRVPPKIKWDKDRGKEPTREKADYPWFWAWDEQTQDFPGGSEFDGNRWNDLHYSRAVKLATRERMRQIGDKP